MTLIGGNERRQNASGMQSFPSEKRRAEKKIIVAVIRPHSVPFTVLQSIGEYFTKFATRSHDGLTACENNRSSSPLGTFRKTKRETSPAARSEEKRLFSQARRFDRSSSYWILR